MNEKEIRKITQETVQNTVRPIVMSLTSQISDAITKAFESGLELGLKLRTEEQPQPGKFCSKCGAKMDWDHDKVYTTNPPMYGYKCPECGNYEYDFRSGL